MNTILHCEKLLLKMLPVIHNTVSRDFRIISKTCVLAQHSNGFQIFSCSSSNQMAQLLPSTEYSALTKLQYFASDLKLYYILLLLFIIRFDNINSSESILYLMLFFVLRRRKTIVRFRTRCSTFRTN